MEHEESLKFLIDRCTDPFSDPTDCRQYHEKLLANVTHQADGPETAFQLLAHKLLSPDQGEVLRTLLVLDHLSRQGGNRVAREIGKFKFLNNFIRILSPKYQGLHTSEQVRQTAVELLFLWRESFRHLDKVAQVYDLLKRQRVIEQDPRLGEEVPKIACLVDVAGAQHKAAAAMAVFEDEQKAQLLAELLKSKRVEDLQAANRMIKSMVRAEDMKWERYRKRREVMESAGSTAETLWNMLETEATANELFNGGGGGEELGGDQYNTMKDLYDSLQALRPTLFRYASESAEASSTTTLDEHQPNAEEQNQEYCNLADILTLNDQINRTMQAFAAKYGVGSKESGSKTATRAQPLSFTTNNTNENFTSPLNKANEKDLICISEGEEWEQPSSSAHSSDHIQPNWEDVNILCSISAANSPAPARRNKGDNLLDLNLEENINGQTSNPGSNRFIDKDVIAELIDLDLSRREGPKMPIKAHLRHDKQNSFLLDGLAIAPEQLDIVPTFEPIVFVQQNQLQAILYMSREKGGAGQEPSSFRGTLKNALFCMVIISSTNPLAVEDVRLELFSTNSLVNSRLLEANKSHIRAFHPISGVENISQVFVLLPLVDAVRESEVDYSLIFRIGAHKKVCEGSFTLKWSCV